MERIDENLPSDIKNELFVARHYKQILIASIGLSILSVFFAFTAVIKANSVASKQADVIKNISDKVIFVRSDGKVAILEKETLSQNAVEVALRDLVLNNMLISAFDFYYSNVARVEETTQVQKIKRILSFFDERAINQLKAYLETIFMSYKANTLPEVIYTPDLTTMRSSIEYNSGKFIYKADIPVYFQYAYAQKWYSAKGDVQISLKGYVDMSKSSPENPLGIYITQIEVNRYVQKP